MHCANRAGCEWAAPTISPPLCLPIVASPLPNPHSARASHRIGLRQRPNCQSERNFDEMQLRRVPIGKGGALRQ
jgi:hypothetical protein